MSSPRKTLRAARAMLRKGRVREAQAKFDEVLALAPDHPEALHGRGQAALAARAGDEALSWLQRALRASPNAPEVLHSLGQALLLVGRGAEALRALEAAAAHQPGDPAIGTTLKRARQLAAPGGRQAPSGRAEPLATARQLLASGRIEEAVEAFERAVEQRPDEGQRHHELGHAWLQDGRLERAERAHREGLRLAPANGAGWLGLGEVLAAGGRRAEAEQAHREAVRLAPRSGAAWLRLVQLRRYQAGDDDLRALQQLVDAAGLDPADREAAHFALAKIYDDLGQPDDAFRHLRAANELHQTRQPFDVGPLLQLMERIETVCDGELLARFAGWGSTSAAPVFIVGLPRCGSTLVEQIIASHPEAYGVGELRCLARLTGDLPARLGASQPFPDCLAQLDRGTVRGLANDYLRRLTRDAGEGAKRICDKMLSHLLLVGLIAVLFPRGRVIHCQRHLMDTGLSMYFHSFSGSGVGYAYDLDAMGRYHRQCQKLMAHWKRLAPIAIVDVHYEALVSNPEPEIRALLEQLGLAWDRRCLAFYEAKRQVRTVSEWQVREPIHTRSVERWRRYDKHLEPLRKYLD